jgi:hypothetical protein
MLCRRERDLILSVTGACDNWPMIGVQLTLSGGGVFQPLTMASQRRRLREDSSIKNVRRRNARKMLANPALTPTPNTIIASASWAMCFAGNVA